MKNSLSQNFFFQREKADRRASRQQPPLTHEPSFSRGVVASARRPSSLFDDDPFFPSSPSSLFDALDREVADLSSRAAASELPPAPLRSAGSRRETEQLLPGGKGFARTRSSSGRNSNSSWSSSETVVVWGVEPPTRYSSAPVPRSLAPLNLLALAGGAALVLYAAVAARFARATLEGETKYQKVSRWKLAVMWPLLAALSPEFRAELRGAIALERKEGEENVRESEGRGVASFSFSPPEEKENTTADDDSPFDGR